jgi:hypothetical protein
MGAYLNAALLACGVNGSFRIANWTTSTRQAANIMFNNLVK